MLKTKHPSGETICLDEKTHIYFLESDSSFRFTPVTKIVNSFFPPFKRHEVARKYAKKHGLSKEEVLHKWETKKDKSIRLGNVCHSYAQDRIEGKDVSGYNTASFEHLSAIDNHYLDIINGYELIGAEYIVASMKFRIAGMIDLLMRDDNTVYIFDWKTNEKIDIYNRWQNCLPPLEHLDASKYNRYSLQLNMYKFILTTQRYFDVDNYIMKLLHVKPDSIEPIDVFHMNMKKILSHKFKGG